MDYTDWDGDELGDLWAPQEYEEILGWIKKGIWANHAMILFLGNPVIPPHEIFDFARTPVSLESVYACVARVVGTQLYNVGSFYPDPNLWVLKRTDGTFVMVTETMKRPAVGNGYEWNLEEVARGDSFIECLNTAWPHERPKEYDLLIRDAGSHSLQL